MNPSDMLPTMRTDEGRSLVTLLAGRDAEAQTLYDAWMAAIVTQREKRERKKFSLTERQQQTIGRYEGDARSMMVDIIKHLDPEPDAAKVGFLLHGEVERVIAEDAFWSGLLSGSPKSAFRRLQKFRLATVELLLAKNVVPWPPGAERLKELAALKEKYCVEVGTAQRGSGPRAT